MIPSINQSSKPPAMVVLYENMRRSGMEKKLSAMLYRKNRLRVFGKLVYSTYRSYGAYRYYKREGGKMDPLLSIRILYCVTFCNKESRKVDQDEAGNDHA